MSPQADFEILEHLLQPMALGPLPETPLVSVLMANFNYARYVGAAIESVLNQTYGNLEVVVCDDGSTDISCEVISTYMQRDRRVRLIRKPNGGHASVLNAAFASSRGQIISLLDSDDMFCEDKLAKIIETFRQAPAAGFVMHRVTAFNGAGESLYVTPFGLHPEGWLGVSLALGNRPSGMPPCSGMSLRREVAERVFPLPSAYRSLADSIVYDRALVLTEVRTLPEPLARYRLHGGNLTGGKRCDAEAFQGFLANVRKKWEARSAFLAQLQPEIPALLPPVESTYDYLSLRYINDRLESGGNPNESHRRLVASPALPRKPWAVRTLWGIAPRLPRPVFSALVATVWGAGPFKQVVGRMLGVYRAG